MPGATDGTMGLERAIVSLPGADTDDALDVRNEDLAVSNLAGLGGLHDGLDDLIDQITPHRHLDARLGNEIDYVFRAAIELGVSALPTEALHLGDRHARYPDVRERGAHIVELERLDDRCDEFHERTLRLRDLRRGEFCSFRAITSNGGETRALAAHLQPASTARCTIVERRRACRAPPWCGHGWAILRPDVRAGRDRGERAGRHAGCRHPAPSRLHRRARTRRR